MASISQSKRVFRICVERQKCVCVCLLLMLMLMLMAISARGFSPNPRASRRPCRPLAAAQLARLAARGRSVRPAPPKPQNSRSSFDICSLSIDQSSQRVERDERTCALGPVHTISRRRAKSPRALEARLCRFQSGPIKETRCSPVCIQVRLSASVVCVCE